MSNHLEPYAARDVSNWLLNRGARRLPDSHGVHQFEIAPGRVVKVPAGPFPTALARRLAGEVGMSYGDLRAALGHPIVSAGRPKSKPTQNTRPGNSKSDVAAAVKRLRRTLAEIEKATNGGMRDSAFYRSVHEHLTVANRDAEAALASATRTGVR